MHFQKPNLFDPIRFFVQAQLNVPFTWVDHGDEYELIGDRGPTQTEVDAVQAALDNYDHTFKLPEEIQEERRAEARERWLSSQLTGKTPAEAYTLVQNALAGASTVAQMRNVLTTLLPVLAAGLVYLAKELEDEPVEDIL